MSRLAVGDKVRQQYGRLRRIGQIVKIRKGFGHLQYRVMWCSNTATTLCAQFLKKVGPRARCEWWHKGRWVAVDGPGSCGPGKPYKSR
jgi:hypothetical protein